MTKALLKKEISIVIFMIDAFKAEVQIRFIKALAVVQKELGVSTHFIHTSGGKLFGSHVNHLSHLALSDADENLYEIQN